MAVRNFYIDGQIDGRGSLTGGPASKDGGINVVVKMLNHGDILTAAILSGFARPDGSLRLLISVPGHETITVETTR